MVFYLLNKSIQHVPELAQGKGRESTAGSRRKKRKMFPSPWQAVRFAFAVTELLPLGTAPPNLRIFGASPEQSLSLLFLPHFCTGSGFFAAITELNQLADLPVVWLTKGSDSYKRWYKISSRSMWLAGDKRRGGRVGENKFLPYSSC